MSVRAKVFVIVLSLGVLVFVINLVRTRKLKEEFALLWLFAGVALVSAPLIMPWINELSYAVGVDYPPAFLFVLFFIFLLFILFQFSVSISRFTEQITVLTQEIALLTQRVSELETEAGQRSSSPSEGSHA